MQRCIAGRQSFQELSLGELDVRENTHVTCAKHANMDSQINDRYGHISFNKQ